MANIAKSDAVINIPAKLKMRRKRLDVVCVKALAGAAMLTCAAIPGDDFASPCAVFPARRIPPRVRLKERVLFARLAESVFVCAGLRAKLLFRPHAVVRLLARLPVHFDAAAFAALRSHYTSQVPAVVFTPDRIAMPLVSARIATELGFASCGLGLKSLPTLFAINRDWHLAPQRQIILH